MKKRISFLSKLVLFWFCLFALQRTIFLAFNYDKLETPGFTEILFSYWYALSMDASATAYLMLISSILIIISLFVKERKLLDRILHACNLTLIISCLIIAIGDTGLHMIWGAKINGKALSYLAFPKEAILSFTAVPYLLFILILLFQIAIAYYIYKKIAMPETITNTSIFYKILFSLIVPAIMIIAIRGGFQPNPINKSWVYYSKHSTLNYAALNGFWNLMELFVKPEIKTNPYQYFPKQRAEKLVKKMHESTIDSTEIVITSEQPNIVFILLESVSAECMYKLNGIKGVMPGMDSLTNNGLLFTNFYANGFRTEQGHISIFTGFPAQPKTTIMREFGKFEKLPNLGQILKQNGYSNNYYYSGNTDFANTEIFFRLSGFEKILNENNYPWQRHTDWGAYDEELFACHLKEADKDQQPFFSVIMTSTNHEPFDADVENVFEANSTKNRYKNTVHYTDQCIKNYLEKAKTKSWYTNTLFIIMSDHAHNYPHNRSANDPERHHIPFLLYGDVLNKKYRGKTIEKIGV